MERATAGAGLARCLVLLTLLSAGGCAGTSAFDQLAGSEPAGSPFQQALFSDYAALARSFAPEGTLADVDPALAGLADAFATKALAVSQGHDVAPEEGNSPDEREQRTELLTLLDTTRDSFPGDAARAQATFDCWVLNGTVDAQAMAAARCENSFQAAMTRLERDLRPAAAAPPAPSPSPSSYTAYFGFDSWTLTAEDLRVLQQVIDDARTGRQSHIDVVGHTDTSGPAGYNLRLSKRRASVVKDALVDMGARREAVEATGVGKSDLAVPTPDGVREARNRRAAVSLLP